jgi:HlyD family secretion protein
MKRLLSILVVAALVGGGMWAWLATQSRGNAPKYRMARVERGPLTAAVSASGNLAAVTTVQVGSQVSGQIRDLFVDFNSPVKKGQVIARIDPATFEAKVNQAAAEVDSAQASVLNQQAQVERARADVENARAAQLEARAQTARAEVALADARRDLERKDELFRRQLIARSERDTSQAAHDSAIAQLDAARAKEQALAAGVGSAQAQLRVAEAQLQASRAQVKQKQAAVQQARVDLEHTTIRAPVNGVVVSRQVDVGQTVAASLQAPTLFTIAQDLTKMQVETSVDEADIGRIKLDDTATFTVDAFPGETFRGRVTQIRKAAQVVQNVVTYTVVVAVENPGGRLLPGMTANVRLVVAEKPSVLKVPNAALRFRPPGAEGEPGAAATPAQARGGADTGGAPRTSPEQIRERLVKALGLSEEQQRKLDPILVETRQEMMAVRGEPLPEGERQARIQKVREASRARIRAILTPEQQRRYDEIAPPAPDRRATSQPGRAWVLGPDGKPKAVSLMLGISDGTATEIVRGELIEGQDVLVGQAGQQAPRPSGSGAPRLRL